MKDSKDPVQQIALAPASRAQVAVSREAGITGVVLAPDGSPVTQGAVALMTSATNSINATIDRTGRFRIVPDSPGWQRLFIAVPGLAPHRLNVTVPPSRNVALPDIPLREPSYFRARFVTTKGEPLSGGLRRRVIDADGLTIPDPLGHVREQVETDGSLTIGPLPHGRMLMAFDRAPLAQTRLRDVDVTGDRPLIDAGVIAIDAGARLLVDVIDGDGKAVPRHDVWLEEAAPTTILLVRTLKTDAQGRVVFSRLGAGRHRVWTRMPQRCGNQELPLSRIVTTSGSGEARARFVEGGRASFRITTPFGPLPGRAVHLSPESSAQPPWQARFAEPSVRPRQVPAIVFRSPACPASTDGEGRFTITPRLPDGGGALR